MEQDCKGSIPGRIQAYLRRGYFTSHGQHVPGRDHVCTLKVGVQANLLQEPFISQKCPIPDLFSPLATERQLNCHCQRRDTHCILATQWRGSLLLLERWCSARSRDFSRQLFLWTCRHSLFWTGSSLSFALFWGWNFAGGGERGKEETEGLFFF